MLREIIGLIAGIFILISFLCKSEKSIRKVSIIGEILYIVYGISISSINILLLNLILIIIQIVRIRKI